MAFWVDIRSIYITWPRYPSSARNALKSGKRPNTRTNRTHHVIDTTLFGVLIGHSIYLLAQVNVGKGWSNSHQIKSTFRCTTPNLPEGVVIPQEICQTPTRFGGRLNRQALARALPLSFLSPWSLNMNKQQKYLCGEPQRSTTLVSPFPNSRE